MKDTPEEWFRKWFVDSLAPLRTNGDAGFIFVLAAFPLLERYLRRKSGCLDGERLTKAFFTKLGSMFPDIAGNERPFWHCYRNGLLHQATFPKMKKERDGSWTPLPEAGLSGHDPRAAYFEPTKNQFYLNPKQFFDEVTNAILADFSTFKRSSNPYHDLASVVDSATIVPQFVPTINVTSIINVTGSYK